MNVQLKRGIISLFFILIALFCISEIKANAIKLSWNLNPENDVKYYIIYKDTTSNPVNEISQVPATDTTYIDYDIVLDKTYYYCIAAIDTADNLSEFSDEVSIKAGDSSPVELISFSVEYIDHKCLLKWATATESKNYGFEIQKSSDGLNFKKISFISGSGTSSKPRNYQYIDSDIAFGKYYYRLKQIDTDGTFTYYSIVTVEANLPQKFELSQNYPNPFNPETTIKYAIPSGGQVRLVIFNVLGREVRSLVDEYKEAGYYAVKWDGRDKYGNSVSSSTYFCRLLSENYSRTMKLILEE